MKHLTVGALLSGGAIFAFSCALSTADAQEKIFGLTSTTFKDGQMMPPKVANSRANFPQNEHCVGENVSPQLSWVNPPAGTKSFAILMVDLEGRGGGGVNHWVAYGIPADITGFAEGEVSKESPKYVGGSATRGVRYYSGPCAPTLRCVTIRSWSSPPISSRRSYRRVLPENSSPPRSCHPIRCRGTTRVRLALSAST